MHHRQCQCFHTQTSCQSAEATLDLVCLIMAIFGHAFTATIRILDLLFGYGTLVGDDIAASNGCALCIRGASQVATTGDARTATGILLLGECGGCILGLSPWHPTTGGL
jgi:hypothetical protein